MRPQERDRPIDARLAGNLGTSTRASRSGYCALVGWLAVSSSVTYCVIQLFRKRSQSRTAT